MNPKRVRKSEQVELIMECRRSGISDYQWCKSMEIRPGTFYNGVSKLRASSAFLYRKAILGKSSIPF